MSTRILVVEDNETNMELMVYLLTAFGYDLITARDGKEGLEKALETLDLIICDLEMPEMNGYEFALQLRRRTDRQRTPLIAVTAYAMVGDRDKILAAGFDGYLPKPIYPDAFVKEIEAFLPPEKRAGRKPDAAETAAEPESARPSERAVILIVDDSPVNLTLLRSTLEPNGYTVVATETVDEAVEAIGRTRIDLILSDLHMPRENGFELLTRVKAHPLWRAIPFFLFTASSDHAGDGQREYALKLGADKFLSRPLDPKFLLSLVDELFESNTRRSHGQGAGR
jgi:CheY-like chemotaxis protein